MHPVAVTEETLKRARDRRGWQFRSRKHTVKKKTEAPTDSYLTARVTEAEHAWIMQVAREAGLSGSKIARALMILGMWWATVHGLNAVPAEIKRLQDEAESMHDDTT